MTWDKLTDIRIATLHEKLRPLAVDFINRYRLYFHDDLRITCGLRSVESQNKLYEIGRSIPGSIVTNANGGFSFHNYGLAFDFCRIIEDKISYDIDWVVVRMMCEELHLRWGGTWAIKDKCHIQYDEGHSIKYFYSGCKI